MIGRRHISRSSATPHLPFDADPTALPNEPHVIALYHGTGHMPSIDPDTLPWLTSGTNLAGTKHNVDEYYYFKAFSDILKGDTTTKIAGTVVSKYGGQCQGRLIEGPFPRGVDANDTGWGPTGWRTRDQARELINARNAGITVMMHEPNSFLSTAADWKHFADAFDATDQCGGGIKTALQLDCASMLNALDSTDPDVLASIQPAAAAATLLPYLQRDSHWHLSDGRIVIGAYDPDELPNDWWSDFFDALPSNIQLLPVGNNWSTNYYAQNRPYMERAGGKSWWTRWDVPCLVPQVPNVTSPDYVWANGGHYTGWLMTSQQVRPYRGWFRETEGFNLMWEQIKHVMENRRASDALYWATWNDLLEGAEIAPCDATQWAILDFATFINYWFRLGYQPPIVRDGLYYMHRQHAWNKTPSASQTYVGTYTYQPGNRFGCRDSATVAAVDKIYTAVFLTAPADIQIITADNPAPTPVTVPAGVTLLDAPLPTTLGGTPRFVGTRDGKTIIDFYSAFPVLSSTDTPLWQHLLYRAGGSWRDTLGKAGYPAHVSEPVTLVRSYPHGRARNG